MMFFREKKPKVSAKRGKYEIIQACAVKAEFWGTEMQRVGLDASRAKNELDLDILAKLARRSHRILNHLYRIQQVQLRALESK